MSFKKDFFLGISAGLLATLACIIYTKMYFSILVDFSETTGPLKLLMNCILVTTGACFLHYILHYVLKRDFLADFLFNLIFVMFSVSMVFYILKMDDPTFKNEDASLMIDYYKGFLMPMVFFPALAWFILHPVFFRKK